MENETSSRFLRTISEWWEDLKRPEASNRLIAIFTIVIALTGILYTVFAGFQWREMNKSSVLINRAWVGVKQPIWLSNLTLDAKNAKANYIITIKNYGPSVALNVAVSARVVVGPQYIIPTVYTTCEEASQESNAVMVQAGNPNYSEKAIGDSIFPSEEEGKHFSETAVQGRDTDISKGIFVVGCIIYKDQFGNQRRTRFHHGEMGAEMDQLTFPLAMYQFLGFNDAT
jgi:hypothetical protein